MFREGKIGVYGTTCLVVLAVTSKMFFASPSQLISIVGNIGWLEVLVSGATAAIAFTFIYLLMKRYPGMDIVAVFKKVFGNILGSLLLILLTIYSIFYVSITLREFADILISIILPHTPMTVILITFLICIVFLSYLGLESLTRTAALFSIFILIGYLAIILLPAHYFRLYRFFPLFGYGLDKAFYYGIQRSSAWVEIIALTIFINSLQGLKNFKKIGYLSIIISTSLIFIGVISYILTFRYYIASEPISGLYHLAQTINYSRYFQRLESIFLIIWVLTTLINLCFGLYFCITLFAKTFNLPDYKPILFPFSILIFTVAILPPNFTWVTNTGIFFIRTYSWIPFYLIPFIALIISILKGKNKKLEHA